jgi:glucokinase
MGSSGRILAALERRLRAAVPFPPSLVCARFLHDAALRGAIALALAAAAGDSKPVPEVMGGQPATLT